MPSKFEDKVFYFKRGEDMVGVAWCGVVLEHMWRLINSAWVSGASLATGKKTTLLLGKKLLKKH